MPKLKTHKGAQKRFKVTGKKKIVYSKSYMNHILSKKTAKRKRKLGKSGLISASDRKRIKRMLPNEF